MKNKNTPKEVFRSVLIHSPNWLGDVIMCFPAFRAWRTANPDAKVYVLAKKSVAGLWSYVRDVDGVIAFSKEKGSMRAASKAIREAECKEAILLPHSFRSAWIVWRGGASEIRGTTGQFRSFMITDAVSIDDLDNMHQAFEYRRIMGLDDTVELPSPSAAVDLSRFPPVPEFASDLTKPLVILPGAARGNSKRWPASSFAATALAVMERHPALPVIVCGTADESAPCEEVAAAIAAKYPARVVNACGKTKLPELAALIAKASAVCCNDSGGMHLSTAIGTPVVAIFGITDSSKTGPLGTSRVVAAKGYKVSRSIPRESQVATEALASVKPETVVQAIEEFLTNA